MTLFGSKFANRGPLKSMASDIKRIADCLEHICREQYGYNVRPPKADTSGPEPETMYVDEEQMAMRELMEAMDKAKGKEPNAEAS